MNENQRYIIRQVNVANGGRIATHYDDCWKYHAGCLAKLLLTWEPAKASETDD